MHSFSFTLLAVAIVLPFLTNGMVTPSLAARAVTSTMQWDGFSNGKNVTLYGTATEIMEQLKAADPNWVPATEAATFTRISSSAIPAGTFCCPVRGQSWNPVSTESTQVALNHLVNIGGTCTQAGHSCAVATDKGAAACVQGAGIHICNDNTEAVSIPCADVAATAFNIISDCPHPTEGKVCGQIFDTAGWNVVVSQC